MSRSVAKFADERELDDHGQPAEPPAELGGGSATPPKWGPLSGPACETAASPRYWDVGRNDDVSRVPARSARGPRRVRRGAGRRRGGRLDRCLLRAAVRGDLPAGGDGYRGPVPLRRC